MIQMDDTILRIGVDNGSGARFRPFIGRASRRQTRGGWMAVQMMVSAEAAQWLKRELNLGPQDAVRVFARYGGQSDIHPGFSLGMSKEVPAGPVVAEEHHGVRIFVREADLWYFDGMDLYIWYDPVLDEAVPQAVPAAAEADHRAV